MRATLQRVAGLKRGARAEGKAARWEAALCRYLDACDLLVAQRETACVNAEAAEVAGADAASTASPDEAAAVTKELQSCRLKGAVCCLQLQQWGAAVELCSEVLRSNPRCATAHHRRAIALHGNGQLDAALWDLKRAQRLQPKNALIKSALAKVLATHAARPAQRKPPLGSLPVGALSDSAPDSLDAVMRQMLASLGGDAGVASLVGAADGPGALVNSPVGGLSGAAGGELLGARAAAVPGCQGASPVEVLLRSPLASSLGGKSTARALHAVSIFLSMQRRLKRAWRTLRPWIPLMFWLTLLLLARPFLVQQVVPYLSEWASQLRA